MNKKQTFTVWIRNAFLRLILLIVFSMVFLLIVHNNNNNRSQVKKIFFLGILSENNYQQRRDAVRNYVLKQFDLFENVLPYEIKYKFILDKASDDSEKENEKYKDIVHMNTNITGYAVHFGYKLEWFYKYVAKHYPEATLIGRMDDDVFLCVEHLFLRLKFLESPLLYYGWKLPEKYIDEQFFVVGSEILRRISDRTQCEGENCNRVTGLVSHKYGHVALHKWLEPYNDINRVFDNKHIFHCLWRKVDKDLEKKLREVVTVGPFCKFFVSFHKADIETMDFLYNNTILHPPRGKQSIMDFHSQICYPDAEKDWF